MKTKPKLPKGYRWLKIGERKPIGYKHRHLGYWKVGADVGGQVEAWGCSYIAPIRKRRKKK